MLHRFHINQEHKFTLDKPDVYAVHSSMANAWFMVKTENRRGFTVGDFGGGAASILDRQTGRSALRADDPPCKIAIVLMFLRSKRLPDHNQVRDPCWGSRCADTLPRPDALGIRANLRRSPRRLHAERLLRSLRPLALSRARDWLPQAFTGEMLGACVTRVLPLRSPCGTSGPRRRRPFCTQRCPTLT